MIFEGPSTTMDCPPERDGDRARIHHGAGRSPHVQRSKGGRLRLLAMGGVRPRDARARGPVTSRPRRRSSRHVHRHRRRHRHRVKRRQRRGDVLVVRIGVGGLFEGLPARRVGRGERLLPHRGRAPTRGASTSSRPRRRCARTRFDERLGRGRPRQPRAADEGGRALRRPHRPGHVDGVGRCRATLRRSASPRRSTVEPPSELRALPGREGLDGRRRHLADRRRGSGRAPSPSPCIPYTLKRTNLREREAWRSRSISRRT